MGSVVWSDLFFFFKEDRGPKPSHVNSLLLLKHDVFFSRLLINVI